jgi:hypothetical protein
MRKKTKRIIQSLLTLAIIILVALYVISLCLSYIEIDKHPWYQAYTIEESKNKKVFICEYQLPFHNKDSGYGITAAWVDVTFKYKMDLFFNKSTIPLNDTVLKILANPDFDLKFKDIKTGKASHGAYHSPFRGFDIYLDYAPDSLFLEIRDDKKSDWSDTILLIKKPL